MKIKVKKNEEIKNIEDAEVVEVGTSVEAPKIKAAAVVEENVADLASLTDRELMEETYFVVLDVLKRITAEPIRGVDKSGKKEKRTNVNKMSPDDKKAKKEGLLAAGPYTKEVLSTWKRRDLIMYASARKMERAVAFGIGTPELITNIVADQKKK